MANGTQNTTSSKGNKQSTKTADKPGDTLPSPQAAQATAPNPEPSTEGPKRGRKPADQQSEEDKKRYAALQLYWGKVSVFLPDGSLDKEKTVEAFKRAMDEYAPYAHQSRAAGPREYLSVEDIAKLAPLARTGYDKAAKPTPDFGKVVKLGDFIDGCYQTMGFDAFAEDKEQIRERIMNTLTDKLGYERVKVASVKRPGTFELSSGKSAMMRRIPTAEKKA